MYELYAVVNLPETEDWSRKKSESAGLNPNGEDGKGILPDGDKNVCIRFARSLTCGRLYNHSGDDCREVPPVPIPNTEVKLSYAKGTLRVTVWKIR